MTFTLRQVVTATIRGSDYTARFIKYRADGYVHVFVFVLERRFLVKPEDVREYEYGR